MIEASLVIITKGPLTLLAEKKKGEIGIGTLNGSGGKLEPGETLVECAIRETDEELGLKLSPETLTKVAIVTAHVAGIPDFRVHVFRTEHFEGVVRETPEMIPSWHETDDLPYWRMLESDIEWFRKAATGEKFCANVYYRERARGFERIEFLPFEDREDV
ncbi:MAG: pyrophosphohydrolase [Parcubacteria bacterium C7867-007]|nr:MAG: pyrophosphohydrolase [Parcubacteria bacterium C7867-007]